MVRSDRRNCTEEQAKYSSTKFPLSAELILIYLGAEDPERVPRDLFPVLARLPVLAQEKMADVIPPRPDPDTKPHLEQDESCPRDTCSARFGARFEAPLEFRVCFHQPPGKRC